MHILNLAKIPYVQLIDVVELSSIILENVFTRERILCHFQRPGLETINARSMIIIVDYIRCCLCRYNALNFFP